MWLWLKKRPVWAERFGHILFPSCTIPSIISCTSRWEYMRIISSNHCKARFESYNIENMVLWCLHAHQDENIWESYHQIIARHDSNLTILKIWSCDVFMHIKMRIYENHIIESLQGTIRILQYWKYGLVMSSCTSRWEYMRIISSNHCKARFESYNIENMVLWCLHAHQDENIWESYHRIIARHDSNLTILKIWSCDVFMHIKMRIYENHIIESLQGTIRILQYWKYGLVMSSCTSRWEYMRIMSSNHCKARFESYNIENMVLWCLHAHQDENIWESYHRSIARHDSNLTILKIWSCDVFMHIKMRIYENHIIESLQGTIRILQYWKYGLVMSSCTSRWEYMRIMSSNHCKARFESYNIENMVLWCLHAHQDENIWESYHRIIARHDSNLTILKIWSCDVFMHIKMRIYENHIIESLQGTIRILQYWKYGLVMSSCTSRWEYMRIISSNHCKARFESYNIENMVLWCLHAHQDENIWESYHRIIARHDSNLTILKIWSCDVFMHIKMRIYENHIIESLQGTIRILQYWKYGLVMSSCTSRWEYMRIISSNHCKARFESYNIENMVLWCLHAHQDENIWESYHRIIARHDSNLTILKIWSCDVFMHIKMRIYENHIIESLQGTIRILQYWKYGLVMSSCTSRWEYMRIISSNHCKARFESYNIENMVLWCLHAHQDENIWESYHRIIARHDSNLTILKIWSCDVFMHIKMRIYENHIIESLQGTIRILQYWKYGLVMSSCTSRWEYMRIISSNHCNPEGKVRQNPDY